MKPPSILPALLVLAAMATSTVAADPPPAAKPEKKITPGHAIVPDRMRRIWGELISLDPETRTGRFRKEDDDTVMDFVVMPYAELLHHATNGDLQDFTPGERAIFRLHEDDAGVWRYLTYIQDEMNFLNNHKEWYYIDKLDRDAGLLTCHQANADESFVRTPVVLIHVDDKTQFFRAGKPITFADLKVGDRIQTKTRGHGQGTKRTAWYVFLDSESLLKFQAEQEPVHAARIRDEGLTGYVDAVSGDAVELMMFGEVDVFAKKLKPKMTGRLAPAGVDRKPTAEPVDVVVTGAAMKGKACKVTLKAVAPLPEGVKAAALIRLWVPKVFE